MQTGEHAVLVANVGRDRAAQVGDPYIQAAVCGVLLDLRGCVANGAKAVGSTARGAAAARGSTPVPRAEDGPRKVCAFPEGGDPTAVTAGTASAGVGEVAAGGLEKEEGTAPAQPPA